MHIEIIPTSSHRTSFWSGGKTTEMFIYPHNASYAERDFSFRISSATVEIPESTFTPLPSVKRFIAPLNTSFKLKVGNLPEVFLNKFDVFEFDGGLPTVCQGMGTDINLLLKGVRGNLLFYNAHAPVFLGSEKFKFIYTTEQSTINTDNASFNVRENTLAQIHNNSHEHFVADKGVFLFTIE